MEKTIDINQLAQDQHNFNKGTKAGAKMMKRSLEQLGAGRSILIDKDGNIIAGNKTQQAAIEAGIKKVRVVESDGTELVAVKRTDVALDSKQGRELALLDNLTTQINLEWDKAELQSISDEVDMCIEDWGVQLSDLPGAMPEQEVKEDDFDETKDPVPTVCQPSDLWQLGDHRLLCGDSTKAEDIQRLMQGETAHLWLTDPPYNVAVKNSQGMTIANDNMASAEFRRFLDDAFRAANTVLADGTPFYIWFASKEHINFEQALNAIGLRVRQELIWNKNSFIIGRAHYQWKHEPCLYGWKGQSCRYFIDARNRASVIQETEEINIDKMKKEEMRDLLRQILDDHRIPTTVINEAKPQKDEDHPTMKPVRLFGYQISNSSRAGEIVLDTFAGSGTTVIACEQLNRKARLVELDPHYCDVIIARWEKFTGKKATLITGEK
ncbi:MAG: DNA modification methylase [Paludibacteraceae bacterium]|nr:DNA modification methylase [Paludibacteraceae bacterium]